MIETGSRWRFKPGVTVELDYGIHAEIGGETAQVVRLIGITRALKFDKDVAELIDFNREQMEGNLPEDETLGRRDLLALNCLILDDEMAECWGYETAEAWLNAQSEPPGWEVPFPVTLGSRWSLTEKLDEWFHLEGPEPWDGQRGTVVRIGEDATIWLFLDDPIEVLETHQNSILFDPEEAEGWEHPSPASWFLVNTRPLYHLDLDILDLTELAQGRVSYESAPEVTCQILSLEGPGGGNPLVRFEGEPKDLARLLEEWYCPGDHDMIRFLLPMIRRSY